MALLLEDSEQNDFHFDKVNAEILTVLERNHILRLSLLLCLKDESFLHTKTSVSKKNFVDKKKVTTKISHLQSSKLLSISPKYET